MYYCIYFITSWLPYNLAVSLLLNFRISVFEFIENKEHSEIKAIFASENPDLQYVSNVVYIYKQIFLRWMKEILKLPYIM